MTIEIAPPPAPSEMPGSLLKALANLPKALRAAEVPDTAELRRIVALPRRAPTLPTREECERFTDLFSRTPRGAIGRLVLFAIQVQLLRELAEGGGAFGAIPVGEGKTLITYLAPPMVGSRRPLLLIPASLRDKTRREFGEYAKQFYGYAPERYRIESYQRLSIASQSNLLEEYQPDLIVCDECQHLWNPRSAAARRLSRYIEHRPEVRFVALTGTITKRSILDYMRLLHWSLRERSPVPGAWIDAAPWAGAIDQKPVQNRRVQPGALKLLASNPEELRALSNARAPEERVAATRALYRRRLADTRGVVVSQKVSNDTALIVRELDTTLYPMGDQFDGMRDHWMKFRNEWELPGGEPMVDSLEVARHARELSLGFYYRWTTPAPDMWLDARREWGRFVRKTLKHSHSLDTEFQVIRAIEKKTVPWWMDGAAILEVWRRIQPSFVPVTEPCWFSSHVINACARWLQVNPNGIVWTEQNAFAERLSAVARVTYYGAEGRDSRGAPIESHTSGPVIASIASSGTGRNLQRWNTNLVTAPPFTGAKLEQLIGRTHRTGQMAPEVSVDLLLGCFEHAKTFYKAVGDCEYTEGTTGVCQKISIAVMDVPDFEELESRQGPRWWQQTTNV